MIEEETTREPNLNVAAMTSVEKAISLDAIIQMANPRTRYDKAELESLADSIEKHGQLQAIGVRNGTVAGTYDLIFGSRRFKAVQILAARHPGDLRWVTIRASIQDQHTGARLKVVQSIENIKRADLTVLELAAAVEDLKDTGLTDAAIGEELGYSKRHVERLLAIHSAPEWLRRFGEEVDVNEPVIDAAGERVLEDGKPKFSKRRLPGFNFSDLTELVSFHRTIHAWDRKQQDSNTAHRPKADSETVRMAQKAALAAVTGDKLKAMLRARQAEVMGAEPTKGDKPADATKAQPVTVTEKRLVIEFGALRAPLAADELTKLKPDLTAALQKLGYTTIKLA